MKHVIIKSFIGGHKMLVVICGFIVLFVMMQYNAYNNEKWFERFLHEAQEENEQLRKIVNKVDKIYDENGKVMTMRQWSEISGYEK